MAAARLLARASFVRVQHPSAAATRIASTTGTKASNAGPNAIAEPDARETSAVGSPALIPPPERSIADRRLCIRWRNLPLRAIPPSDLNEIAGHRRVSPASQSTRMRLQHLPGAVGYCGGRVEQLWKKSNG